MLQQSGFAVEAVWGDFVGGPYVAERYRQMIRGYGLESKHLRGNYGITITDEELAEYKWHLEELVQTRTGELEEANQPLREEATAREQAEQTMRASEQHLRRARHPAPDGPGVHSRGSHPRWAAGSHVDARLLGARDGSRSGRDRPTTAGGACTTHHRPRLRVLLVYL